MGILSDQLLRAGCISKEKYKETEERKKQQENTLIKQGIHRLTTKSHRPTNLDRLENCETVNEFKNIAQKILLEHLDLISDIIQMAHRFKGQAGGDKLVWSMYQIRDKSKIIKTKYLPQFLKRVLRKSGATVKIPREWIR